MQANVVSHGGTLCGFREINGLWARFRAFLRNGAARLATRHTAAHSTVERKGRAMTETEPKRTPANQNPWYVLMTLYGEQTGEMVDTVLHAKNRDAWNAWAGFLLPEAVREDCVARGKFLPELDAWHDRGAEIRTLHKAEMLRRNGADFSYPGFSEPHQLAVVDMSAVDLNCIFCADDLVFPRVANFKFAKFGGQASFDSTMFIEPTIFDDATMRRCDDATMRRCDDATMRRSAKRPISHARRSVTIRRLIQRRLVGLQCSSLRGSVGLRTSCP